MERRPPDDLLSLPLRVAIWRLALPSAAALFLRMISHSVDQFWVGRLPEPAQALAAVSSAGFVMWMVYSAAALFNTGLQATVARAVGARDTRLHAEAYRHGLIHAVLAGVVIGALGLLLKPLILGFEDLEPGVRELSSEYLRILLLGLPLNYLGMAYVTCFRAEGDTITPLRVLIIGPCASFVLDPFLIHGLGPCPQLGVAGAAIVNVSVSAAQALVLGYQYRLRRRHEPVPFEWAWLWRLTRIGYPLAGAGVLFSSVYVGLVRVLAPFGEQSVAALGLSHTIEGYTHFLCVGFGAAAATLVGQHLGAGDPDAAERAAFAVARQLVYLVVPMSLLIAVAAPWLLGLYMGQDDPAVIRYGSQYLWVIALTQFFLAYEVVMWQAQAGAGSTWPPTLIDLIVFPARIPVGWLLAHALGLGPLGVWWAIGLTAAVGGILQTLMFRRGFWRTQQV